MLKEFSAETAELVKKIAPRLVHIGGSGISGRTGTIISSGIAVTIAREAEDGETVPMYLHDGRQIQATVKAFDPRTGLVLLAAPEIGADVKSWQGSGLPELGNLVVTVAHPSPNGIEASLSMIRYVGGASRMGKRPISGHLQTDSPAFPGFEGAAVVNQDGVLVGIVAENESGNHGWILPAQDFLRMIEELEQNGSWKRPWIGVNLVLTTLDQARTTLTGSSEALLVSAVASGSPAEAAGILVGDLLPSDLESLDLKIGVPGIIRVIRGGSVLELTISPRSRED